VKVIELRETFDLNHVVMGERPDPEPGPGQLLLRIRAASLNYRDWLTVRGLYNPKQALPLVLCSDGVGEVMATGEGVERVKVGQRVVPAFAQSWISGRPTKSKLGSTLGGPLDGTLTQFMVVDAEGVVAVPEHLNDEEAATLPCAGVTAWNALTTPEPVRAGETVLVQGTGGVAIYALQLAQLCGARVIVTSSSDEKLERARALGAWKTLNYTSEPEWGKRARQLTDGIGVDRVIEVGGAGTLAQSLAAVRPGGQISLIGVLAGGESKLNIVPVLMQQIRIQGILVGSRELLESLVHAVGVHEMRPAISRIFPFEDARAALEHMASGAHFGKICVRVS